MTIAESASQKDRLFAAIVKAGGFKTWLELKSNLDFFIDPHNGTHLLYSLQKEGLITLREKERPLGQESKVIDIRPTRKALAMTMNLQPEYLVIAHEELVNILDREGVVSLEGQPAPRGRPMTIIGKGHKRHPVGKDMTDPGQHKAVAQGGPIERTKTERPPEQNERPISELIYGPEPHLQAKPILPPLSIHAVIEWSKYPQISQLVSRGEKVTQAAKLMEEAGLADQAIAILETVTYTDFEKEVLSLVKDLG